MRRYGSLININLSVLEYRVKHLAVFEFFALFEEMSQMEEDMSTE